MSTGGKRAGSRRAAKKKSLPSRKVLLLCLAVTVCVVAWGYLVYAAIDFGSAARGGQDSAWAFLGLACLGAAGCLFVGLMLSTRVLRQLGIIDGHAPPDREPATDPERLDGVRPTLTVSPVVEDQPSRTPVPAPRTGEQPRGKRVAEKAYHPDSPQQSGGRRIAR